MDNYLIARDRAREYFLQCARDRHLLRPGVREEGDTLRFPFLGMEALVSRATGRVDMVSPNGTSWEADYAESLSVYDWLCDSRPDAVPSGAYCPIHSLPGILVGGNGGLSMGDGKLCSLADRDPAGFRAACEALGGEGCPMGEIGYRMLVFPDLSVILKFYHSDEDFPAQLTILWDRNTLQFVRYETAYYIAGVLFRRLRRGMGEM